MPLYVAVVVATSIEGHGHRISGDAARVVIVEVADGPRHEPESELSGTVVAVLCPESR